MKEPPPAASTVAAWFQTRVIDPTWCALRCSGRPDRAANPPPADCPMLPVAGDGPSLLRQRTAAAFGRLLRQRAVAALGRLLRQRAAAALGRLLRQQGAAAVGLTL